MTQVINLIGGPGSGKSTVAAATFAELKYRHLEAELVTEFAKELVWDKHFSAMENQIFMLGQQYHRIHRLLGKVAYVVTDAPILLQFYYGKDMPESFQDLVLDLHRPMETHNFFLMRPTSYSGIGRRQSKEAAEEVDRILHKGLTTHGIRYSLIATAPEAGREIVRKVLDE